MSEMKCTNCTVCDMDKCVSSTKLNKRKVRSRTIFKLQPLERGKFKIERERGSLLKREE